MDCMAIAIFAFDIQFHFGRLKLDGLAGEVSVCCSKEIESCGGPHVVAPLPLPYHRQ